MFKFLLSLALVLIFSGCSTLHPQTKHQASTASKADNSMSCSVKGRVKAILPYENSDSGTVCAIHHCRALIEIIAVYNKGGSFTMSVNEGEAVTVRFMYTLNDTRKVYPDMKTHFPGLKMGNVFTAALHQRLKMATDGELVIEDYQLVK